MTITQTVSSANAWQSIEEERLLLFDWLSFNRRQLTISLIAAKLSVFQHYFFLLGASFGGVIGLPVPRPPYWYLAFFSDGFSI